MSTMHCALENGADLYVSDRQKIYYVALGLLKKEECQIADFFYFARCIRKFAL